MSVIFTASWYDVVEGEVSKLRVIFTSSCWLSGEVSQLSVIFMASCLLSGEASQLADFSTRYSLHTKRNSEPKNAPASYVQGRTNSVRFPYETNCSTRTYVANQNNFSRWLVVSQAANSCRALAMVGPISP